MATGGNARSKFKVVTPGPWWDWPETDPAERAIRFIQTYCRAPKGFGYGQPLRLAPFQREWIADVLAPGIRQGVLQCPRGQGKSTKLAALAVWPTFDRNDTGEPQVPIMAPPWARPNAPYSTWPRRWSPSNRSWTNAR